MDVEQKFLIFFNFFFLFLLPFFFLLFSFSFFSFLMFSFIFFCFLCFLFFSLLFYSTLFYSTLFYSILLYSILSSSLLLSTDYYCLSMLCFHLNTIQNIYFYHQILLFLLRTFYWFIDCLHLYCFILQIYWCSVIIYVWFQLWIVLLYS